VDPTRREHRGHRPTGVGGSVATGSAATQVADGGDPGLERTAEVVDGRLAAHARFTTRADGDLAVTQPPPVVAATRAQVLDRPWSWLHQVHGAQVVVVERPGQRAGAEADGSVTAQPGAVLSVQTADCAPIALLAREGVVGAVHAGWRGLEAGVVDAAVATMRQQGATEITAVLGPCIHAECYEFGEAELDRLTGRFGPSVRGRTSAGTPALDLPAAVRGALRHAEVTRVDDVAICTACDQRFFSHRARGDTGRQALVVWLEQR
jgi:YfiH family protein